jgi:hypothetical protein
MIIGYAYHDATEHLLQLEHLVIEVNVAIGGDGEPIDGAAAQISLLHDFLNIHLTVTPSSPSR